MRECPQHPFMERCAHLGGRFIYESRSLDRPVTSIVGVVHNMAEYVFTIPRSRDFDEIYTEYWEQSEQWLREGEEDES